MLFHYSKKIVFARILESIRKDNFFLNLVPKHIYAFFHDHFFYALFTDQQTVTYLQWAQFYMAQSQTKSSYRGLDVFCNGPTQVAPVLWEYWAQRFQLLVIAGEEVDIEEILAKNALFQKVYSFFGDINGPEDLQVRKDRMERNERVLQVWRVKKTRLLEDEKRLFK